MSSGASHSCRSQTWVHKKVHRKGIFNLRLRKGATSTPPKITSIRWNTMGEQRRSKPWPTTRRRWLEAVVKDWPLLGGGRSLLGTSWPLLRRGGDMSPCYGGAARLPPCGGINPYTLMARHGQAQTRRSAPLHDDARSRSSRWSLAQGIKPDLGIKQGLGRLG
jgi:hypothetical protein